jgi:hypothetical protein
VSRLKVALDCDVPDRLAPVLNSLYGHKGFEFFPVTEFADGDSSDDHWADAFKRFGGKITISGDAQIAYKPHKVLAFIDNGFMSFFFSSPWHQAPGHVKASHAIYWWPIIQQRILLGPPGRCWRIPSEIRAVKGRLIDVRLAPGELEALVIPDHVLEQARAERGATQATGHPKPQRAARSRNDRQGGLGV